MGSLMGLDNSYTTYTAFPAQIPLPGFKIVML